MNSQSPRLGIPYLVQSQAQKEVTHNEAINILELLVQSSVIDIINTPPSSPSEGDMYIIGTAPTGSWVEKQRNLTGWIGGAWKFLQPIEGWNTWVQSALQFYWYHLGEWEAGPQGPTGDDGASAYQVWLAAGNSGTTADFLAALKGDQGAVGAPGIAWQGAWNTNKAYAVHDAAFYGGSTYLALIANTGVAPGTSPTTWATLAQKGADGIGVGDMMKAVYDADNDGKVDSADSSDTVVYIDVATVMPVAGDILVWDASGKFLPSDILNGLETALATINGV